jgi:hypothetical protein
VTLRIPNHVNRFVTDNYTKGHSVRFEEATGTATHKWITCDSTSTKFFTVGRDLKNNPIQNCVLKNKISEKSNSFKGTVLMGFRAKAKS